MRYTFTNYFAQSFGMQVWLLQAFACGLALTGAIYDLAGVVTNKRRLLWKKVCLKSREHTKFCNLFNSGDTEQVPNFIPYPKVALFKWKLAKEIEVKPFTKSRCHSQRQIACKPVNVYVYQIYCGRFYCTDGWWCGLSLILHAVSYDLQNSRASSSHHHKSIHDQKLKKVRTLRESK